MRLLHVIHTLNPASGGTAETVKMFARHSRAEQSIATLDRPADPWIAQFGPRTHCLGPGRGKYGYSRALQNWLKENAANYHAIIVHGVWQYHGVATRRAARAARIPYFVLPQGMLDGYFNRVSPLKHLKKLAYWPLESAVLRDASAVFFTAAEEKENAFASFRLSCKTRIVPLGVQSPEICASDRERFLDRFPETRGQRIILFLGRIHPKKGVDLLVSAFKQQVREGIHLVIAGPADDPGFTEKIREAVEAGGLSKVTTFAGMLTGALKQGALQAADAFVLPSHQENFGIAVAEALAFGLPVLISNRVNIWREIEQDGAGWVAADTLDGTTQLLARWFALLPSERDRMRIAARGCFERRFRAEAAAEHLLATLRECGVAA